MTIDEMIDNNSKLVYDIAHKLYIQNQGFSVEDLAQVGFLALCRRGDKYDPSRGAVTTFITHCVRNEMIKFIQKNKRRNTVSLNQLPKDDMSYDFEYFDKDEYLNAMKSASDLERSIVDLKLSGNSQRAIARTLNISQGTVSKVLNSVRKKIAVSHA